MAVYQRPEKVSTRKSIENPLEGILREFEAYDPSADETTVVNLGAPVLSPSIAHRVRESFQAGKLADETKWTPKQRGTVNRIIVHLGKNGVSTLGELREASEKDLLDIRNVSTRGIAFMRHAFRRERT